MTLIACDALLSVKARIDLAPPKTLRIDEWLSRPAMPRGQDQAVVVDGARFLEAVLPFSDTGFQPKRCAVMSVDPNHVMAGCYRHPPVPDDPQDLMDALDQHSMSNGLEVAQFVRVDPFDLYVACEGKNRVSLFREFKRNIVARVTVNPYPLAADLQLVKLRPFDVDALVYSGGSMAVTARVNRWQAIRVGGLPGAVLPFKESVEALIEYGVHRAERKISLSAWLRRREALLTVANEYYVR